MEIIKRREKSEDLTLEEAKMLECCKGLTDQEIEELLATIKALSKLAFTLIAKEDQHTESKPINMAA